MSTRFEGDEGPGGAVPGLARRARVIPRGLLALGAGAVALGIALVGTSHPHVGGASLLAGWLLLGSGLHRFGRDPSA